MRPLYLAAIAALVTSTLTYEAQAFCGFYVAKADTQLFNRASKVVIAREHDKTVMTMANDFQGDLREFAIVVPVPTFIEEGQIHVGNRATIEHLEAYTAPRLVEYHDTNPCVVQKFTDSHRMSGALRMGGIAGFGGKAKSKSLGVKVEAQYSVEEYDIMILSAKESHGLATWLNHHGYTMPEGAAPILGSYIKQKMRFFVAKVNLQNQSKLGYSYLRPLQVAYESPKFMLPIRLGTLNANGDQELFAFTLTRKGRVETTNYRTVPLPTGNELPGYVKEEFGEFYKAMFTRQVAKEKKRVVFLEYAWDMSWCDPCAANPLSHAQLRELGVFWLDSKKRTRRHMARDVYVTRMHVRYDAEHFPEDLVFQETANRQNFQGRYVLRHQAQGDLSCPAGQSYLAQVAVRKSKEAQTLARLTGWELNAIREKAGLKTMSPKPIEEPTTWWQKIWNHSK